MKKQLFLLFTSVILFSSCSNDDNQAESIVSVSSMVRKSYNTTTGETLATTVYEISDNKIQSTHSSSSVTSDISNSVYTYSGDRLSSIENSRNGIVTSKNYLLYNSANKLVEYRTEVLNPGGAITLINKQTFAHTPNGITSQWTRSNDNGTTFSLISSTQITLDSNDNQTFLEDYDNINNETNQIKKIYDSNNNIVTEEFYNVENNNPILAMTNTVTYNTHKNTLSFVMEKTYGRDVLMLLYPYAGGAINNIDVKSYSPNSLNTFSTTFGEGLVTFSITNTANANNYTEFDEFQCFNENVLISKFTYEYNFN